ncbi:hypothetical protein Lal_00009160 [Lupinus albus]|nr:hypothetical protein Lal_00009160 [Lupinus albus]
MSDVTTVNCPTCGKTVVWGEVSPFRPFCCKRCQLIDLGEWAAEEKRIPSKGDLSDSDDWSESQQLISWREFFGITCLKLHPVTRLPLFPPGFTFPVFHQPEPQRDVSVRKLVLKLIKQRCAKRGDPHLLLKLANQRLFRRFT